MATPEQKSADALHTIAKELTAIRRLMERKPVYVINIDANAAAGGEQVKRIISDAIGSRQEDSNDGVYV